jgi:hypothetical protein
MSEIPSNGNLPRGQRVCPECGAISSLKATKCYLCGRELAATETTVAESTISQSLGRGGTPKDAIRGPATYSLSSLLIIVTVLCVFFGLIASAPGLGIPLAILVTPALVRTMTISRISKAEGISPSAELRIGAFFSSLAVMIGIFVAASVAFFAACSAVAFGAQNSSVMLGLGAGLIVALIVGICILVGTWPKAKNK